MAPLTASYHVSGLWCVCGCFSSPVEQHLMLLDVLLEELVLGGWQQLRPPSPDATTAALHSPDRPVAPKVLARWRQLCWCQVAVHVLIRPEAGWSILKRCLPLCCVIHVFPFAFSLSVCSCLDCGVCLCGVPSLVPSNTRLR